MIAPAAFSGVDFSFSPTSPTVGQTTTFTATVFGGTPPLTFSWNFGDATPIASGNPTSHAYSFKGTFTVTLTVTDSSSPPSTATITHQITVSPLALTADFTASPSTPCVGTAVTFSATASGGTTPFSFRWNFGDGTPNVAGQTVSHAYIVKATYMVKVNATDSSARLASASSSITINPLVLITSFTFSPTTIPLGSPITFTAITSGGTTPYSYSWNFGDGSAKAFGNPVQHTYTIGGPFLVTENATDSNGKTATITQPVGLPPQIALNCPTTGTVGSFLTCVVSVSGGTAPITFLWSATGGSPSSGAGSTFSTTYSVKGSYTISVKATDSSSPPISATAVANVVIQPLALTTDFTAAPSAQCINQQITYTASVSGGTAPYSLGWNFGDGSTGTGNPTTHIYRVKGTFTVTLNVTDGNGARTIASHIVTALGCAYVVTINGPLSGTVGAPVTFTASATGGIAPYRFSWNFGDGSVNAAGSLAAHTYTVKGTYNVRANATDITGLLTSASTTITIFPLPLAASFTVSTSSPNVAQPVTFTSRVSGGTAPYIFAWNFGDGSIKTSFASQIMHAYSVGGMYTVTLNATDANGVRQSSRPSTVTVLNPDFTILANPTILTLKPETSTTTAITLTSIAGFTGTISLNATITPTGKQGPLLTISTPSLTIMPGTPGSVLLTVTAKGSTALGSYTIVLTAISGNLTHTITIPVTVTKEH